MQRNPVRAFAVSMELLRHIQWETGDETRITSYNETIALLRRVGNRNAEAVIARNWIHAYFKVKNEHDLDEAERWYPRSLELRHDEQQHSLAKWFGGLNASQCGFGILHTSA